jgi:hypothetical protein
VIEPGPGLQGAFEAFGCEGSPDDFTGFEVPSFFEMALNVDLLVPGVASDRRFGSFGGRVDLQFALPCEVRRVPSGFFR